MINQLFLTLALATNVLTVSGNTILNTIIEDTSIWKLGSQIITGNLVILPDSNTTTSNALYVEDTKVADINSSSGVTLYQGGLARQKETFGDCTATGGLTTYSTCWIPAPLSTSGSLLEVALECGDVDVGVTGDVSFKLTQTSASGAPLTNLDAISVGTGSLEVSDFTTEVAWNPQEGLSYTTLDTVGTGVDCRLQALYSDKYGD